MVLRKIRGRLHHVLTEELVKKVYWLILHTGRWKFYHAALFSQSQKHQNLGQRSCVDVSSRTTGWEHWALPALVIYLRWEAVLMGEGAHLFLSAVWTTTVLTLPLLEGISKGHLVPLGRRVIYSFVISYSDIIFYEIFFFLKICSNRDCMQ